MTAPDNSHAFGKEHRDVGGGGLRAGIFGLTDGLVTNLALILAIAGAQGSSESIILTGTAGLLAGAASMAVGEYTSVSTSNESIKAELAAEQRELHHEPEKEAQELTNYYTNLGIDQRIATLFANEVSKHPEAALHIHAGAEMGVQPGLLPKPKVAAISSFILFCVGAFIPLLPYILGAAGAWPGVIAATIGLLGAGLATGLLGKQGIAKPIVRQVGLGLTAAAITYGLGVAFATVV